MTAPYRRSVQQFIKHFREQGEAIAGVESELHRKILYCSAMDPLARSIAAPRTGNRTRFVALLRMHANWPDADRVSLFQLRCALRLKGRSRFRLYREACRRLNVTSPRRHLPLSHSPLFAEIEPLAKAEEVDLLCRSTYAELFYTFRNNLIHEYREPGYGHDWLRRSSEPFYTNVSSFGDRELVFPVAFVARLYDRALQSVADYLLEQKISPHSRFEFGSHWRAT